MAFPYSPHHHAEALPDAPAVTASIRRAGYRGSPTPAIRGVVLNVPAGARVALVGPNGAGKSTVLKAVAGLIPHEGRIEVFGHGVNRCRHRAAYLPQRAEVDWRFPVSVERLVLAGRYVHLGWLARPGRADFAAVAEALDILRITDLAKRQIGDLSGGQQQRALLARALAQRADLLLLDEPLNAVDAATRQVIADVLDTVRTQGRTVLMATHDLGRLEADFDGALYLCEGRVVAPPPGAFVGLAIGSALPGDEAECVGVSA
ncbi:MAG: ABC transporter ATP-binding protein [Anaerolineales bacterium]|nr:ABC transporter ATP-binding protein [Anaerolineales bacterium]